MLVYALSQIFALNFQFFIDLALNNIYFLFGFAMASYYLFSSFGKNFFSGYILLLVTAYSFGDFLFGSGWIVAPAFFIMFLVSRWMFIYIFETNMSPRTFGFLLTLQFLAVFVIFNVFLV